MDETEAARILAHPSQIEQYLASSLIGDPAMDAGALVDLLEREPSLHLRPMARLAALEAIFPLARETLALLERRIVGSSIPLSSSQNGMVGAHGRLAQTLLDLYQQVLQSLRDAREPWWGTSPRLVALTRAADLLTLIGRLRRLVYLDLPEGFWGSFHALLLEGERTRHLEKHLETSGSGGREPSLKERYIAFALLELSAPDGLPHQEMLPLHQCFLDLASKVEAVPSEEANADCFIHFDLMDERPPGLGTGQRPLRSETSRALYPRAMLEALDELLESGSRDNIMLAEGGAVISRSTLERTVQMMRERAHRHVHRQAARGVVHVWAGRTRLIRRLKARLGEGADSASQTAPQAGLSLSREGVDSPAPETLRLQPLGQTPKAAELWDMVAQRHLVPGEPFQQPVHRETEPGSAPAPDEPFSDWQLVDASASGLHLRSQDGIVEHLNMGEPVLVEFPESSSADEVIGVLRWLHNQSDQTLEMGLEIIASSAIPVRVSGAGCNTTVWYEALLVTRSRLCDGPLLVLPNQDFKAGDHLISQRLGDSIHMQLGERLLHTAAVAIFQGLQDASSDPDQSPARI